MLSMCPVRDYSPNPALTRLCHSLQVIWQEVLAPNKARPHLFLLGAGWGDYLWQLGLEACLLRQCIINGLQEAPFHHIEGLEAQRTGGGVRAMASPTPLSPEMSPIETNRLD